MAKLIAFIGLMFGLILFSQCSSPSKDKTIQLSIKGMWCTNCAKTIEELVSEKKGIHQVSVNYVTKTAIIEYDTTVSTIDTITSAITNGGFQVK